jgi:hypothetical protein
VTTGSPRWHCSTAMVDIAEDASCQKHSEASCRAHKSTDPFDRPTVRQAVLDVARRRQGWSLALPFNMAFRPWFVDKAFQKWCVLTSPGLSLAVGSTVLRCLSVAVPGQEPLQELLLLLLISGQ